MNISNILNEQESEIARLVNMGFRNKEIAKRLNLCEGTIKNKMREIFDKVGMHSRLELGLWYDANRGEEE